MATNKLQQYNSNKIELFVLASSYFRKHSIDFQLQIDNNWSHLVTQPNILVYSSTNVST